MKFRPAAAESQELQQFLRYDSGWLSGGWHWVPICYICSVRVPLELYAKVVKAEGVKLKPVLESK